MLRTKERRSVEVATGGNHCISLDKSKSKVWVQALYCVGVTLQQPAATPTPSILLLFTKEVSPVSKTFDVSGTFSHGQQNQTKASNSSPLRDI